MNSREEIIKNYINGYNSFNTEMMSRDLDENLLFENISNGNVTDSLVGKQEFMNQAEQAKSFFSERHQKITAMEHFENYSEITIEYSAKLSKDLSPELNIGDSIQLDGKSIFEFSPENKIIVLKDIS
ncbi:MULTISPECIES: nuclear transport factor 2 family protein [unclassified Sphingobacterium]|uniref:nuclear transport factor 2 family protein n=1 Tax=unclassified Sphingobacterium TaxID=2609468 RepID=UPI0020C54DD7|nr:MULTISPECIES: nuclear transport factor 2 family protein [unclassified Sphingobacterium]